VFSLSLLDSWERAVVGLSTFLDRWWNKQRTVNERKWSTMDERPRRKGMDVKEDGAIGKMFVCQQEQRRRRWWSCVRWRPSRRSGQGLGGGAIANSSHAGGPDKMWSRLFLSLYLRIHLYILCTIDDSDLPVWASITLMTTLARQEGSNRAQAPHAVHRVPLHRFKLPALKNQPATPRV
jgi:hypothetical protein